MVPAVYLLVVVKAAAVPERFRTVRAAIGLLAGVQAVVHGQVLLHLELGWAHAAPPAPLRAGRTRGAGRRRGRALEGLGLEGPTRVADEREGPVVRGHGGHAEARRQAGRQARWQAHAHPECLVSTCGAEGGR